MNVREVNDQHVAPSPLSVAARLRPIVLHLARHLRRELKLLGVTGGQATLLAVIRERPGIGVRALAAMEGVSPAAITGHVDRLEAVGLVRRTRDEAGDRRRVGLALTDEGERVLRAVRRKRTHWLATRLEALDPDELQAIDDALGPLERLLEASE
ncbi:MAG: MarR family transcriptional regulator [Actinomycetota bacterium]|nr:MarR family transcriptional regulator [Actinomycetota bacterium]